jgi:hypothetical protein
LGATLASPRPPVSLCRQSISPLLSLSLSLSLSGSPSQPRPAPVESRLAAVRHATSNTLGLGRRLCFPTRAIRPALVLRLRLRLVPVRICSHFHWTAAKCKSWKSQGTSSRRPLSARLGTYLAHARYPSIYTIPSPPLPSRRRCSCQHSRQHSPVAAPLFAAPLSLPLPRPTRTLPQPMLGLP